MPELPTYTASGQIRAGPVAAPTDASVLDRPARALAGLGQSISYAGNQLGEIVERKKKEDELRWVTESMSQFRREMAERQLADQQNPRETEGIEFKDFADQQLDKYGNAAPSKRAADLFRSHALDDSDRGYKAALAGGEQTRLVNADVANQKTVANLLSAFKTSSQYGDTDGAAMDLAKSVKLQNAYIEEAYEKTMPAFAAKLRTDVAQEIALGTADTHPEFARKIVANARIDENRKRILNNQIDAIERNATETASFNTIKAIENTIAVGYDRLVPVPMPHPSILKALPANQAQRIAHDVEVANGTISKFSEVRSWNWMEQRKAINAIDIAASQQAPEIKANLAKLLQKSQEQQTQDPAGWQYANDPEFSRIPANEDPAARMVRINRMVSLQGAAPSGADEQQAKRYLNLPTGLQNALTVDEAKARAQTFNNSPPNQLTTLVDKFDAEFTDSKLAAMAWNDMQNLPEGEGKLRMGIRMAVGINDATVRNHFLGGVSAPLPKEPKDPHSAFETRLFDPGGVYDRFVSGWKGDGNQRGTELKEFRDSTIRYAKFIAQDKNMSAEEAVDIAVKRIITDNYGIMSINGADVPVYKFPKGGTAYSDRDIEMIQDGIGIALQNINVDSISTDKFHFPLQPDLPGDKTEANRYLSNLVRSAGTVAVEPDGQSATVYIQGQGVDDFAFQLRGADGNPVILDFENMLVRGAMQFRKGALPPVERSQSLEYNTDLRLQPQPSKPDKIGYFGIE